MQCHWSQGLRPQAANRMLPQISKIPSIGIVWIEMLEKDEGHHWTKLKNLNFPNFFFFCSQNFNLVVVQYYFKIFLWNTFYLLDKYSPMSSSSSLNRVAESSFFPGLQDVAVLSGHLSKWSNLHRQQYHDDIRFFGADYQYIRYWCHLNVLSTW